VFGKTSAQKGARNFSNNCKIEPHNKYKMFTIALSKKDRKIFNQFQLTIMKVIILSQIQGFNHGLKALRA
jgi:hypothetical protein